MANQIDLAISRQALEKMCKISYYPHVILIFLVRNTFDGVMVWTLFLTLPQFSRKLFLFFFGIGLTETIGEIMILHCSFWNIYIEIYLKIPTPLWNLMEAAQRMGVSPRAGLIDQRETTDEELPLTFSDRTMVRNFSRKARNFIKKHWVAKDFLSRCTEELNASWGGYEVMHNTFLKPWLLLLLFILLHLGP